MNQRINEQAKLVWRQFKGWWALVIARAVWILRRPQFWWPVLIAPVVLISEVIYASHCFGAGLEFPPLLYLLDTHLELIAPWLLMAVVAVYWAKAIGTRNPTYVVLGVMAGCLLLRELHWDHTIKTAIFPLLGICGLWAIFWRDLLDKPSENRWHTVFFFSALATYGLGQFVEKRLFRGVPHESAIHSQMEESAEIIAHVLLLLAALLGSWRRSKLTRER